MKRLKDLAYLVDGRVVGDGEICIKAVASIEDAAEGDITFLANRRFKDGLKRSGASAFIVSPDEEVDTSASLIRVRDPYVAFVKIFRVLIPPDEYSEAVHPSARISPDSVIGDKASIYPNVVIEEGVTIGDRVVCYPGVYVGKGSVIGEATLIYPNVTIREGSIIGRRVVIHAGSVVGSDGFGYISVNGGHLKVPQRGTVEIEDDVEIGACVTIDRATIGRTIIRRGTKIDNLVQIAHNVDIGEESIIVAQVGIAGSTHIGNRVTLAGKSGVKDHIKIGDDVTVGACSCVINDLPSGKTFIGFPAIERLKWLRARGVFTKLPEIRRRVTELEKKVAAIMRKGGL